MQNKNLLFSLLLLPMFAAGQQTPNRNWSNSWVDSLIAKKSIAKTLTRTDNKDANDYLIIIRRDIKMENSMNTYYFKENPELRFLYHIAGQKKSYNVDTLLTKSQLADSLCRELTKLSLTAEKYFTLLQEAYLELRRLKSDSLADRLQNVTWDRKFKPCNIEKRADE